MYGTAEYGGESWCYLGCGTVFELKRQGSQWAFNVIYTFQGGADGQNPKARVVFGPDGTLYGTTTSSEDPQIGGTLFNLKPPVTCWTTNCQWTKTVLNTFNPTECVPDYDNYTCLAGDLTFDSAGNIYGTTAGGGTWGEGTVFKLTKTNNGWIRRTLYSFLQTSSQRPDGMNPFSGVVFDEKGNLWGTTYTGGGSGGDDPGYGVVFELTPSGQDWNESIRVINGAQLYGGVIFDSAGLAYVGAYAGGTGTCSDWEPPYAPGCGTVVRSSVASSQWTTLQNLQQIGRNYPQPGGPMQPLALDAAGNVYGGAYRDPYGAGMIFELTAGTWDLVVLHQFNAGNGWGESHQQYNLRPRRGTLWNRIHLRAELQPARQWLWSRLVDHALGRSYWRQRCNRGAVAGFSVATNRDSNHLVAINHENHHRRHPRIRCPLHRHCAGLRGWLQA